MDKVQEVEERKSKHIVYAETLGRVCAVRAALEAKVKELKEAEEKLERFIITEMLATGNKAFKTMSGGNITLTEKDRVELADKRKFITFVFKEMVRAVKEGRPLEDAMFFQNRVGKEAILSHIADNYAGKEIKDVLQEFGLRYVVDPALSFKDKKNL